MEQNGSKKLIGKIFIKGEIRVLTGLHIGGSKTSLDIGGIDLNVIKTAEGVPFIPGSSFKGKLRSLLAKKEGSESVAKDSESIQELFGSAEQKGGSSRILVRDMFLDTKHFAELKEKELQELELEYTEVKTENRIERKTGAARDPRQLERVPAGAKFMLDLVYDNYDDGKTNEHLEMIKEAMRLVEDDYIGGQGSRGYGKVKFENVTFAEKTIQTYETDNTAKPLTGIQF